MDEPSKRKQVLGRGFNSLISENFDTSILLNSDTRIENIPIDSLQPNPNQPRKHFDDKAIAELSSSIKRHGIIQPLVVTPLKDGKYTLIAGERRWRAAKHAKLKNVPAIIRSSKELEQLEIALIENVQRVDLNPLEQALSIEALNKQFGLSFEVISQRLGKATSTVNNIVRLLQLPEEAKVALSGGKITEGHARALLSLKEDSTRQAYLLKTIIDQSWNVRQAERFVISIKEGIKETKKAHERTLSETPATKKLSQKLGTGVHIRRMAYGGKLEINFADDNDLDRILDQFQK